MITLKAARINKGYTCEEASRKLHIGKTMLTQYEHGRVYPSVPTIKKMEKLYGIKFEEIDFMRKEKV